MATTKKRRLTTTTTAPSSTDGRRPPVLRMLTLAAAKRRRTVGPCGTCAQCNMASGGAAALVPFWARVFMQADNAALRSVFKQVMTFTKARVDDAEGESKGIQLVSKVILDTNTTHGMLFVILRQMGAQPEVRRMIEKMNQDTGPDGVLANKIMKRWWSPSGSASQMRNWFLKRRFSEVDATGSRIMPEFPGLLGEDTTSPPATEPDTSPVMFPDTQAFMVAIIRGFLEDYTPGIPGVVIAVL